MEPNTSKSKFVNSYVLFVSLFVFQSIWIFQGFDVSDYGWHLTNQARLFGDNEVIGNLIPLSNHVGGIWLKIIGEPNILWARLGGVLLYSFSALLSYKILSVYFDREKVFFVVVASTLFLTARSSALIHYYSLPALLLNLELLIFNQLLNSSIKSTQFKIYSVLLGFMTIPIILARFPLILIVFIPIPVFLYYVVAKENIAELNKSTPYVFLGTVISLLIFTSFYKFVGFLNNYLESVKTLVSGQNTSEVSIAFMMQLYIKDGGISLGATVVVITFLYFVSLLKKHLGDIVANLALIILATFATLAGLIFNINLFAFGLIWLAMGLIMLVSLIFLVYDKERNKSLNLLLLTSVFIMLITPMGSGAGLIKARDGMWVVLPLILLITYRIRDGAGENWLKSIFSLNTAIISLLIAVSLPLHFTNIYRDNQNRLKLNTEFKYKYLRKVYSHKERVEVVDEVLTQINQLCKKNDEILMINEIPMFYYLTQTKPFFVEAWLFVRPSLTIKTMYNKAIENKRYPKLFVYSKTDTTSFNWPNDVVANDVDLPKLEYLKDKYINELGYNLVMENPAFAIYSRPAHLGTN